MIIRAVVAFGVGWGALYGMQTLWLTGVTAQISNGSAYQLAMPAPAFPTMEIDTSKMMQAINRPVVIDTKKYESLAIQGAVRQMELQRQAIQAYTPKPIYIPGLHH